MDTVLHLSSGKQIQNPKTNNCRRKLTYIKTLIYYCGIREFAKQKPKIDERKEPNKKKKINTQIRLSGWIDPEMRKYTAGLANIQSNTETRINKNCNVGWCWLVGVHVALLD